MAINEACQVWIEQAVAEEIEGFDGSKPIGTLARELAKEVERVFQTAINHEAIRAKMRRLQASRPNGRDAATPDNDTQKSADIADKLTPEMIVNAVEGKVKEGKSVREATKEVAAAHGKKPDTIHRSYSREKERINSEPKGSLAQHFAARAIQKSRGGVQADARD
ncbi:MAG: hypothetical protein A2051_06815 [Desulfovibrionales bacterium GWA2_65_9]|nr:MAG: hypothetical protein A2051_06815 [Desulfovibrionales bacterium GWA2_65_9]